MKMKEKEQVIDCNKLLEILKQEQKEWAKATLDNLYHAAVMYYVFMHKEKYIKYKQYHEEFAAKLSRMYDDGSWQVFAENDPDAWPKTREDWKEAIVENNKKAENYGRLYRLYDSTINVDALK